MNRLVIVGASGMVGGCALRYALEHSNVERVTSVGRRKLSISHPKLTEVLRPDFADCSALAGALRGQDAAIFCLSVYTGAVTDAELRTITVDYTVEFAQVSSREQPRCGILILEREWRRPNGPESDGLRSLQGDAENALSNWVSSRLHLPVRVHLPRRGAQGAEFQLPRVACDLPHV